MAQGTVRIKARDVRPVDRLDPDSMVTAVTVHRLTGLVEITSAKPVDAYERDHQYITEGPHAGDRRYPPEECRYELITNTYPGSARLTAYQAGDQGTARARWFRILWWTAVGAIALALLAMAALLVVPGQHYENRDWILAILTVLFVSLGVGSVAAVAGLVLDG